MKYLFEDALENLILEIKDSNNSIYNEDKFNQFKEEFLIDEKETLGSYYYKLLKDRKSKGIVYTPHELAEYVIRNTIKEENLINNPYMKILDPSCGVGNFIISCYRYLYNMYCKNLNKINNKNNLNLTLEDIPKQIIENNLYGFDIDNTALKILKIDLWKESNFISEENFKCSDFLLENSIENFDFIIGNPPYIGHKAIDKDYVKVLKEIYKDVYKNKGDIFYCFFKKAFLCTKEKGGVSFITSRYMLESQSGEHIRKFVYDNFTIEKIVDFYGIRPFKEAGIDPFIIFLKKIIPEDHKIKVIKPSIEFINKSKLNKDLNNIELYRNFNTELKSHNGIWILLDEKEKRIMEKIEKNSAYSFSEKVDTFQGIITGCDKAFIIDKDEAKYLDIEKELLKPWIKSSYIEKGNISFRDKYLIYADDISGSSVCYPNAIKYIERYKEKLVERRECKKGIRQWFMLQWGRNKEIFENEKIIFPYKSSNNRFAIDKGSYFSADIYAMKIKDEKISYNYLLSLLNSSVYEFYFKCFLKKLGENTYEYYPNKILNLKLYLHEDENINDEVLKEKFKITEEEYRIINSKI